MCLLRREGTTLRRVGGADKLPGAAVAAALAFRRLRTSSRRHRATLAHRARASIRSDHPRRRRPGSPTRMRTWPAAAAVLLAIQTAPARADRDPQSGAPRPARKQAAASPLTDHFYIRASYYAPQLRTNLRVDPSN